MKKEKVKQDMVKGCNSLAMIAVFMKYIMLAFTVILAICIIGSAIETFFSTGVENRLHEVWHTIREMLEEYSTDENNTFKSACKNITQWFVVILTFDRLHKLLKVTVKEETPFCQQNIKNIRKLFVLCMLIYFLDCGGFLGVNEIFAIIIITMGYLFRFGCLLQQESDETL